MRLYLLLVFSVGAALAATKTHSAKAQASGFVPREVNEQKLHHEKKVLDLVEHEASPRMSLDNRRFWENPWAKDDDWPPIYEPWRCLDQSLSEQVRAHEQAVFLADPDCPLIDKSWCQDTKYHAMPCNCHAYYQCTVKTTGGELTPCIYKCNPYDLVFNPANQNCDYAWNTDPVLCIDTPPPPASSTTAASTTTEEITTTTTTTTTPTPTPTPTTTSTSTTTTTTPTTTTDGIAGQCKYAGEMLPYPGDCHKYYRCLEDDNNQFYVEVFDCGDWVFDPNQASCTWPGQDAADNLCNNP